MSCEVFLSFAGDSYDALRYICVVLGRLAIRCDASDELAMSCEVCDVEGDVSD